MSFRPFSGRAGGRAGSGPVGAIVGVLPRNKKGDDILAVGGGDVRVVLERTDSARTGGPTTSNEEERNRNAVAALGLVRTTKQNGGQTIRVMGARRIVMALDPRPTTPTCCPPW